MFISTLLISFFTLVEFNCENLFDCVHDSLKNDYEYLPNSERKWSKNRYWEKLTNISKELIACGGSSIYNDISLPDICVVCEVENDSVMTYLTRRSLLRKVGYHYIVTHSLDSRGIDVGMLYQPSSFRLINTISFRLPMSEDHSPTRDILYASGEVSSGDTLHIYMVHLPSRLGNVTKSMYFRMSAAVTLRNAIDSLCSITKEAKIIVAGDFNDYEGDSILTYIEREDLSNISSSAVGTHGAFGSYKYKGDWKSIDHVLISKSLYKFFKRSFIEDDEFLLEPDKVYGGKKPRRTYVGYKYNKGYSDHLPTVTIFGF
jgi:endonuclease/exonuclease/phosphatase family metal-dependent hydrolase